MPYTLNQISNILNLPAPKTEGKRNISVLLTDSRSLTNPEETLFFALRTSTGNGHRYISHLYEQGVRAFCVESGAAETKSSELADATFLEVESPLDALQALGRHHRCQFDIPVVGITGSRGKTTVKEWLYTLLSDDYDIVRSPRSYNSQIGVPLSIWEMTPETRLGIFEAGISQAGEMEALQEIIRPTIGVITTIGTEHDEGFSTHQAKVNEKAILMRHCECVIYNGDDPSIVDALNAVGYTAQRIGWSRTDSSQPLYISDSRRSGQSSIIEYAYMGRKSQVTLPFTKRADIDNAISCMAVMLHLGRADEEIKQRMERLTPVATRLQVMEGVNSCLVIYDSYTSDLHSLAPALDFMSRRATSLRTPTVIISDLQHENLPAARVYRQVAELLQLRGIKRVIGIGEQISQYSKYFPVDSVFYPSTSSFLTEASPGDFDHELILVKGAPNFQFELVAEMLEAKQHETVLEVNLDNIVHNFNFYRARLRPTTGIVCMVKASGYGAGSYELAKTLQSQGAAYLAVAVADEGVDLRKAGITMPIMVLNPRVVNYKTLFAYNLEPEIYSFEMLDQIVREGEKYGITDYPVHIKLDTGMHRLGFLEPDIPEIIRRLHEQKVVRPASVFSHLAAADDPAMDDYTRRQFEIFDICSNQLQAGFHHHIMRHILNSTGITRFPDHQFDMVRLGICLYGIPTMDDGSQADLRPVSALYSAVISIKEWEAGETIGYNRRGVLKRHSRIATVPVGYADGIDRHLGNGHMQVMINGHRCPTVGNVCMDVMMVDVTDAPTCSVGDTVEIFGPNVSVCELAATLDTIPYEVLTSVSTRVKRVYYRE